MAARAPLPEADGRPIDRLLQPFQQFMRLEAAGGILLLVCTVVALAWANSPWRQSYHDLWHTTVTVGAGGLALSKSLHHWVNDGLMAVFFFVVGLEIKRELLVGELASPRKALVPIMAAAGGMIAPAAIYAAVNLGGAGMDGWAIPAATDIAFALGIMALLGKRVPLSLKIFLTALAIVDDIGAVLIIAIFYTADLSMTALGVAGGVFVLLILASMAHVRQPLLYALLGIVMWVAVLKSGVHATVAGVLAAFTIPARFRIDARNFLGFGRRALDEFERAAGSQGSIMTNGEQQKWVLGLENACEQVQTPLMRLEHLLHPWVSFFIMPVFALANAGVELGGGAIEALASPVSLGVILGLVLGKQIGVMSFTWLAVRLGLGDLPAGANWKQVYATSWLAGIGFTMSLFIANLGFGEGELLEASKIGILTASLVAGVVGFLLLRRATAGAPQEEP